MSFSRYDGTIANAIGTALAGVEVFVCTQPADTTDFPPTPLASIFAATTSNAISITGASWELGVLELTLASIPADLVVGSYISATGSNPASFNGIYQVVAIVGNVVILDLATDPGTYIGSATANTSVLPNPILTDGLGNFFFYATPGEYTVVYYDPQSRLPIQVFADQTVATPGGGVVNSVTLTMPDEFEVEITGSSDVLLAVTKAVQNANSFYAGPASGSADLPEFRGIEVEDLPGGLGTVTSVGLTVEVPSFLTATVTDSPVTDDGTIDVSITANTQAAGTVYAGPASGSAASPGFRALALTDIPGVPLQKTVTVLTSAQLKALMGTPISLVAAQGANTLIIPIAILIEVLGGTVAYTDVGGEVEFVIGSAVLQISTNAVFTTPMSNKQNQFVGGFSATDTAGTPPTDVNAPLQITKITNDFAAGNGTAQITVIYAVVAFA